MSKVSEMMTGITAAWENLSEKDRKTLLFAAPVILFLVLYLLVFQPVQSRYQEARVYKTELSSTLVWLYENTALVERLQNACTRQRLIEPEGEDLLGFAKNIGRRSGVKPDIRPASHASSDLAVTIKKAQGNRALAAVHSFGCHGYLVSDFSLARASETTTEVDLRFTLSPSSYLRGQN